MHISASTQNQALSALLFLYRNVLILELGAIDSVRAKPSQHVPTVLSRAEVQATAHWMSRKGEASTHRVNESSCLHRTDASPRHASIMGDMDLFDHAMQQRMHAEAPLAARMRPRTLAEFVIEPAAC